MATNGTRRPLRCADVCQTEDRDDHTCTPERAKSLSPESSKISTSPTAFPALAFLLGDMVDRLSCRPVGTVQQTATSVLLTKLDRRDALRSIEAQFSANKHQLARQIWIQPNSPRKGDQEVSFWRKAKLYSPERVLEGKCSERWFKRYKALLHRACCDMRVHICMHGLTSCADL